MKSRLEILNRLSIKWGSKDDVSSFDGADSHAVKSTNFSISNHIEAIEFLQTKRVI